MGWQPVSTQVDFIKQENEILEFWQTYNIFSQLKQLRERSKEKWRFLDGPITANNPMGVHHAWGRAYKDLFNRYQAMLGKKLLWQQGFDCQGLWVEVEEEREHKFDSKKDIENYGIERFVNDCKARVLKYAARQTRQSIRLGYWMNWNNCDDLLKLEKAMRKDDQQIVSVNGRDGAVSDKAAALVGSLGSQKIGGSYFTFSHENNYTIWSFLQKLWHRGKIYKGRDVVPWGGRSGTSYSQMEVIDGRKLVAHTALFVRYQLLDRENEYLLIWTTTPWTLTSNIAAAVNVDLDYCKLRAGNGDIYYFAAENYRYRRLEKQFKEKKEWIDGVPKLKTLEQIFKESGGGEIIDTIKGSMMIGWRYRGPFDELPAQQTAGGFPFCDEKLASAGVCGANAHRVIDGGKDSAGNDVVVAGEGTGIVHIATGCGEIDHKIGEKEGLPQIAPLNEEACFLDQFGPFSGRNASDKKVVGDIIADLRQKELLVYREQYPHVYPHCWRSGEELVYRLVEEWYIRMDWRDTIKKCVDEASWYPEWGREREHAWLDNMGDWMISKKRIYGLALPIWEFEDDSFYVVGSIEELKQLAVEGMDELLAHSPHRPWIDKVKIRHPESGLIGRRIEDVGNPWLDAGIVAYSSLHYVTCNDFWQQWFPADWVSESFPGQFRNWFYSLLAQSAAITGKAPFKNLFSYGLVIAEDGREMHKSWGNAIWFDDAVEKMGADTMRWLYIRALPEKNLRFGFTVGDETRRGFIIPVWNIYAFFIQYAIADNWTPEESTQELVSPVEAHALMDHWIKQRLAAMIVSVRQKLDAYQPHLACAAIESMVDDLSNWYVRRSRRRFWNSSMDDDKRAAYRTLYRVIVDLSKVLAPFTPFISEAIYRNMVAGQFSAAAPSVHLTLYPERDAAKIDYAIIDKMDMAIRAASLGRSARGTANLKIRQPLAEATIVLDDSSMVPALQSLDLLLREELNVKKITVESGQNRLIEYELLPNSAMLGKKLGPMLPKVKKALAETDSQAAAQTLRQGESLKLQLDQQTLTLLPDEVIVRSKASARYALAGDRGITVGFDPTISSELKSEGFAKDIIRNINTVRKERGLDISERIDIYYNGQGTEITLVTQRFADLIKKETLADKLEVKAAIGSTNSFSIDLEKETLLIEIVRKQLNGSI